MMKKGKVVIILGMHRSGTSCLAGTLESRGLYLGNVQTYSPFNKKGNRENPIIFNFQESIFNKVDSSWYDPPTEKVPVTAKISEQYLEIISEFKGKDYWGFKDPRTVFTLDLWLPLLSDYEIYLIASFRHPLAVGASLEKRNNFSIEKGVDLWKRYNQKLIHISDSLPINFIDFNQPGEAYQKRIAVFCEKMGLSANSSNGGFFEKTLVNCEVEKNEVTLEHIWGELYFDLKQKAKMPIKGLPSNG